MSTSQPSKEVYILEVPDCVKFNAEFVYNYFDPQESVSESAGIPKKLLMKSSESRGSEFQQFAASRVPRWISLSWKLPRLMTRGLSNESVARDDQFNVAPFRGLIRNNMSKIMSEDAFASNTFAALTFQDSKMDEKIFFAVSGSYVQQTLDEPDDKADNHYRAALRAETTAPDDVNPEFINTALTQPLYAHGVRYKKNTNERQERRIDKLTDKLNKVSIGAQINTRIISSMLERASTGMSNELDDFDAIREVASMMSTNNQQSGVDDVDDNDYKLFLPYVEGVVDQSSSSRTPKRNIVLVGYIIDKREVLSDGSTIEKDPIILENPRINETIDFNIKYNAQYAYQVRAVYMLSVPSIDELTGDIAMLKILISSKPSQQEFVATTECVSPPPPTDINFLWDYRRKNKEGKSGCLMVHWTFPTNPQRDIKHFQVFRRRSIEHAFELVKMYSFDDSEQKFSFRENYNDAVVETLTSPATWWYDEEFLKTSKYIYTICSVDAHGYVSNYGAQFEVWFDVFENRIMKKLVSHTGAPRPYPNLFLERDLFVDTIKVAGEKSKTMSVYFNPEYYRVYDDDNKNIPVIATNQTGGRYKLQLINLDNQKQRTLTIHVDDILGRASELYVAEDEDKSHIKEAKYAKNG